MRIAGIEGRMLEGTHMVGLQVVDLIEAPRHHNKHRCSCTLLGVIYQGHQNDLFIRGTFITVKSTRGAPQRVVGLPT